MTHTGPAPATGRTSRVRDKFDSMLAAHLLAHMSEVDARGVVSGYLPYVRGGGRVVFITPRERGFAGMARKPHS
jgi:hypothetical protein